MEIPAISVQDESTSTSPSKEEEDIAEIKLFGLMECCGKKRQLVVLEGISKKLAGTHNVHFGNYEVPIYVDVHAESADEECYCITPPGEGEVDVFIINSEKVKVSDSHRFLYIPEKVQERAKFYKKLHKTSDIYVNPPSNSYRPPTSNPSADSSSGISSSSSSNYSPNFYNFALKAEQKLGISFETLIQYYNYCKLYYDYLERYTRKHAQQRELSKRLYYSKLEHVSKKQRTSIRGTSENENRKNPKLDSNGNVETELEERTLDTTGTMDLSNKNLGDEEVRRLSEDLQHNDSTHTIDLSYNDFGDEGFKYFAQMLEDNETLLNINLSGNRIGDEGVRYLAHSLEKNNTIQVINLSNNLIGNEGDEILRSVKEGHDSIESIDLSNNRIDTRIES